MNSIESIILAMLAVGACAVWWFVLKAARNGSLGPDREANDPSDTFPVHEGEEIDAHQLGEIEANIKDLTQVIVTAHRVDAPKDALRKAVEKNLQQGVEYRFLVSKSHAQSELDGWVNEFLAIAHVVLKKSGSNVPARERVQIWNLDFDWRDKPHVFYRAKGGNGQLTTVAFRGNQTDEGIAEKYTRLPAGIAYSLALAILSDAPHPMSVKEEAFHILPEVDVTTFDEEKLSHEATFKSTT